MRAAGSTALAKASPADRPLRGASAVDLAARLDAALAAGAGVAGAHCVHELAMRGAMAVHIERALAALWLRAADSIPDWLPMRPVDRLAEIYDIAGSFRARSRGRSNIYLVLLDYQDRGGDPYGLYVGMSRYAPAERFDQHKAGIRAAGSVLKRGLEALTGPTRHLLRIGRADAARIEVELAAAYAAAGFLVRGGH